MVLFEVHSGDGRGRGAHLGITIQNEPEAKQVWDSCLYTGEEERDFIKNCLGPSLEKHSFGDVKNHHLGS
ncbi:MAG: hypothetical protein ACQEXE_04950 [Bacillota bacterium]